jgi:hypothetical protein
MSFGQHFVTGYFIPISVLNLDPFFPRSSWFAFQSISLFLSTLNIAADCYPIITVKLLTRNNSILGVNGVIRAHTRRKIL